MSKWEEKRSRPVLPLYLAALAWPVCALLLPIYTLGGLAATVVISLAVLGLGYRFCPTRVLRREVPYATGDQTVDAMLEGISGNLNALRQLNQSIPDAELSRQMDRMERAGRSIVQTVADSPDKANQVSRFARYYLPEAVKILSAYARMEQGGIKGENAERILGEVRANAGTIATAFENQLDALYRAEALDISTDIEVLEGILKSQNLAQ